MRQRGLGVSADAVCRKMGITRQTLRNWERREGEIRTASQTSRAREERTKSITYPESVPPLIHIQTDTAISD